MSEAEKIAALEGEVRELKAQMRTLLRLVGIPDGDTLHEQAVLPNVRCASLTVAGSEPETVAAHIGTDETGGFLHLHGSGDKRFGARLSGGGEHGATLRLSDSQAGESQIHALLGGAEDGVTLALCGTNGVPRVVLSGREVGGGLVLVNAKSELAAELFGVNRGAWLALYRGEQPAVLAYGIQDRNAGVEVYDEQAARIGVIGQTTQTTT